MKVNYYPQCIGYSCYNYYTYYDIWRINYYKCMQMMVNNTFERLWYENMLLSALMDNKDSFRENEFTIEELSQYDGKNGKPAYVAVDGNVYDMSKQASWGGGTHFGLYSGKDLSSELNSCHNKVSILSKLTKIGVIKR